jgi:dephospho-CoA kinase
MPDAEKRKRANYVVGSDKGMEDMRQQLMNVINSLQATRGQG